ARAPADPDAASRAVHNPRQRGPEQPQVVAAAHERRDTPAEAETRPDVADDPIDAAQGAGRTIERSQLEAALEECRRRVAGDRGVGLAHPAQSFEALPGLALGGLVERGSVTTGLDDTPADI